MSRNILILYHFRNEYPMRQTFFEHLYSFKKYAKDHDVYYVNASYGIPSYLHRMRFDLVVIHSLSIAYYRWRGIEAEKSAFVRRGIGNLSGIKVALPQDECVHTRQIEDLFLKLNVSHIFSVANSSEWEKIYPRMSHAAIHQVLTGYLEEDTVNKVQSVKKRDIDLGYRAWSGAYWAGRHAVLKGEIGKVFLQNVKHTPLTMNISSGDQEVFRGMKWYEFLSRCKYVLGVEGGSSILDEEGKIKKRVEEYLQRKPQASFEEVENICFPGKEGSLKLKALSPRHLEACVTKTCQVLVEGEYNGILKPWKHYLPLRADLSNIEEMITYMQNDHLRETIVSQAYQDIVASGKYTYRHFVDYVLQKSFEKCDGNNSLQDSPRRYRALLRIREAILWKFIPIEAFFYRMGKKILFFCFPPWIIHQLKMLRWRLSR